MNFRLLYEVIASLEDFELQNNGKCLNLEQYRLWLNRTSMGNETLLLADTHIVEPSDIKAEIFDIETAISKVLVQLSRYAKVWIKKTLANEDELVNEDFTYIFTLMREGKITKTELIQQNIHEKATGLEIIKRLQRFGFVQEVPDEQDKRSKCVLLTEKGKMMFFKIVSLMRHTSQLITGNLTLEEKKQLLSLLQKLDDFHKPLFLEEKNKSLEELLTYIQK